MSVIEIDYDYTLEECDRYVLVDTSNGPVTVALPANHIAGQRHYIKDRFGTSEESGKHIFVISSDLDLIDDKPTFTIQSKYVCVVVHSDGRNWSIL